MGGSRKEPNPDLGGFRAQRPQQVRRTSVNLLKRILPPGARADTGDKFQGQEAELVNFSL